MIPLDCSHTFTSFIPVPAIAELIQEFTPLSNKHTHI